jgi:DMSO/TMAO reductase YedYZ molybdopterin-dependent catalytic subunit
MKRASSLFARYVIIMLGALLVIGLAGCGGGAPKVDWDLEISGAVGKPLTLSYSELVKMPQVDLKDILMEKSLGEDETGAWSGVSLAEILSQADVSDSYVSVTALAADGYAIEITKDELQDAIVALKKDGEWITDAEPDKGPIRLVCPQTPANRWVFQLQTIEVNE